MTPPRKAALPVWGAALGMALAAAGVSCGSDSVPPFEEPFFFGDAGALGGGPAGPNNPGNGNPDGAPHPDGSVDPDGGDDAGDASTPPPDAGGDAGSDGGKDGGADAGKDGGADAGKDGGTDGGKDGGPDGGADAGSCGRWNCSTGCCIGITCMAGNTNAACGTDGGPCVACGMLQSCTLQRCVP